MDSELQSFLSDLIEIIQDKYNDSLNNCDEFNNGLNFAYYDVLEIIESQLRAFNIDQELFDQITPVLGEEFKRKK
ncbi:hypothetical protein SAMN04488112_1292 [Melghirimyces thermohalophilus]|uniref:Uncharacterized protein n=1 Tax=Melghirimyces thermohalophilus TaxID=1236220 RepID=A0A1G6RLE4_9BACL|nr:hypothetical protein [Melghirimyces thermohalophilus]SDD05223.1 hypothetical protein SAMN04488112_1292 [Melghirimyces thermohalophilus]